MASTASARRGSRAGPPSESARYWPHAAVPGVDLLRARYVTHRYARHAHETYTLALIEDGVEEFRHDGVLLRAPEGSVALLNPEVVHTGHAGVPEGWAYRVLGGFNQSSQHLHVEVANGATTRMGSCSGGAAGDAFARAAAGGQARRPAAVLGSDRQGNVQRGRRH